MKGKIQTGDIVERFRFPDFVEDLVGPWSQYFEPLFAFYKSQLKKIVKVKDFKPETMRSFFFAKTISE